MFCPVGDVAWMKSHTSNPFGVVESGSVIRIFFSTRDERNRSSIGSLWVDIDRPGDILQCDSQPLVAPGEPGFFDDSGASMGSVVQREDGCLYLYYVGWNLGVTVPWRNSIGLAVSSDGGRTFEKHDRVPVMDRSSEDPFTLSYPFVMGAPDGNGWLMWYGSHRSWQGEHEMDHVLKRATSDDGVHWTREDRPVMEFSSAGEYAMCRPGVLRTSDGWRMWFAFRGERYRIGCAESEDGRTWTRRDEWGLEPSGEGWDASEVTYPHVFECGGRLCLLYNGDGYGRTGFGLCIAEDV